MSYCRIGENGSDVYMFTDGDRWFIDTLEENQVAESLEQAKTMLLELRERGIHVPDKALQRVERELEDPEKAREEREAEFLRELEQAIRVERGN